MHNSLRRAEWWAERLDLLPHPEGGYYKEVYRAEEVIPAAALPERFGGERSFGTSIYFLLPYGNFSAFHKIASDEIWHFYEGTGLHVYVLHPEGNLEVIKLGRNPEQGEVFQAVVPAGAWFASRAESPGGFALVGCTVAPGFDFADFVMADRNELSALYPKHKDLIASLTRSDEQKYA